MKNKYKLYDDYVEIYIISKFGNFTTYIDLDDFDKVNSIKGSWYVECHKTRGDGIVTKLQKNKIRTKLALHRFIMNCPENLVVDHKDGNVFNNRKSNLRIVTVQDNCTNLPSQSCCKSGYRNIYIEKDGKFAVRINNKRYGRYNTLEKALEVRDKNIKELWRMLDD